MARTDLDAHCYDTATLATARAAFDLAIAALQPEVTAANSVVVEREVAAAIADLLDSSQPDVDRLRAYAVARGWLAANMRATA